MTITLVQKQQVIELVAEDGRVPPLGVRVFVNVMAHVNRKTGYAWMSQETLGARLGCSARSVRSHLTILESLGYLEITRNIGLGGTNHYRPWVPTGKLALAERKQDVRRLRKAASNKPIKEPIKNLRAANRPKVPSTKLVDPDQMENLQRKAEWVENAFLKSMSQNHEAIERAWKNGAPELVEQVAAGKLPPKVALRKMIALAAP